MMGAGTGVAAGGADVGATVGGVVRDGALEVQLNSSGGTRRERGGGSRRCCSKGVHSESGGGMWSSACVALRPGARVSAVVGAGEVGT